MNTVTTMHGNAAQEDVLAFLAYPAKRAAEQVTGTTTDLFQSIGVILNQVVSDAISKRTAAQFSAALDRDFSTYMQIMLGLNKLINATVPAAVTDRLTHESLSEMEADFRDEGRQAFGDELTNQVLFTVWTLRKINDLADRICMSDEIKPHLIAADRELAAKFLGHVLMGRFHLDCLRMSLRTNKSIYPEVLECISDGLRPVVNAYAYIKQASDMRSANSGEAMIDIEFDDEERELLRESMAGIQTEA